jgi:hypothetical protein
VPLRFKVTIIAMVSCRGVSHVFAFEKSGEAVMVALVLILFLSWVVREGSIE